MIFDWFRLGRTAARCSLRPDTPPFFRPGDVFRIGYVVFIRASHYQTPSLDDFHEDRKKDAAAMTIQGPQWIVSLSSFLLINRVIVYGTIPATWNAERVLQHQPWMLWCPPSVVRNNIMTNECYHHPTSGLLTRGLLLLVELVYLVLSTLLTMWIGHRKKGRGCYDDTRPTMDCVLVIFPTHNHVIVYGTIPSTWNAERVYNNNNSLRRRANAQNVSFRISLRWPVHIVNPVDKTKLSRYTFHRHRTTVL